MRRAAAMEDFDQAKALKLQIAAILSNTPQKQQQHHQQQVSAAATAQRRMSRSLPATPTTTTSTTTTPSTTSRPRRNSRPLPVPQPASLKVKRTPPPPPPKRQAYDMEVTCPTDSRPGTTLLVQGIHGETMMVTVPDGVAPGGKFYVHFKNHVKIGRNL